MNALYLAQYFNDHNMMSGQDGGWGLGMMLISALFLVAVVVGVVYLLRANTSHHHQHHNDSLDIAKSRYAKGDISKEEFDRLKKDLT